MNKDKGGSKSQRDDRQESDEEPTEQVDHLVDDLVSDFVDTVNECESVDTSEDLSSVIDMLQDSYDLEDLDIDDQES